jgi:hypothetical protein
MLSTVDVRLGSGCHVSTASQDTAPLTTWKALFQVILCEANYCSYVQLTSSNLSLPIPLGTTALAIILPIFATINVYYTPVLQRISQRATSSAAAILLASDTLQIIQGVLTVILATIFFNGFLPSQNLDCSLRGTWMGLWRAHDGKAIERIQNAFDCCGLNSQKDMSWPQHGGRTDLCSSSYQRSSSCAAPWKSAMQRNSGLDFGVAVAVGIAQVCILLVTQQDISTVY